MARQLGTWRLASPSGQSVAQHQRPELVVNVSRILLKSSALLGLLGFLGAAQAASATFNGSLGSSDPAMPVVTISGGNCSSQGSFAVHYDAVPFTVDAGGSYSFSLTSAATFASLYLYQSVFNPASGLTNCIAAENGTPVEFSFALQTGTTYTAVPFDDTFNQLGGDYSLTIDGPGVITAVPEPQAYALFGAGLLAMAGLRRLRQRGQRS